MYEKIEIIPIIYANSVLSEDQIILGGKKELVHPISFSIYLIVCGNKRILVDTGCEEIDGFVFKNYKPVIQIIREKGFKSEDITDVIITHSHHDHVACVKYFSNAIIHIHEQEYNNAKSYITEELKIHLFNEDWDLERNIKIVEVGGHTVASCVVIVEGVKKKYLLCGDEFYTAMCIQCGLPTGNSYNREKSLMFLQNIKKTDYEILYFHDIHMRSQSFFVE